MVKSFKVALCPNDKQTTRLYQFSGCARWVYNWTLQRQQENYTLGKHFLSNYELRKELTKLKDTEEFNWLKTISNNVAKQAVKDACDAYIKFFRHQAQHPKFKSRKKSKTSFYQDNMKIKFNGTHVKLESLSSSQKHNKQKLNWVRLAEHGKIPVDTKYINPRITFDGLNWWISVGIKEDQPTSTPENNGIGIDVGIKDLAICSDDNTYKNINKTSKIKKLEKRKRRLQRQVSKKYEINKGGSRYKKTCNIISLELKILKTSRKITNIRHNYLHQVSTEIIKRKPSFIVMENLNISGMMKNKHLAKSIQQQCLYEFKRQIQYKSEWHNIKFIEVSRWYPSSKMCSECGAIYKELQLKERKWTCPSCSTIHDRDFNAGVNLKNYASIV